MATPVSKWLVVWAAVFLCGCGDQPASPAVSPPVTASKVRSEKAPEAALPTEEVPAVAQADDWFEDITERSGVRFTYRNGREAGRFYLIESFGGGVAAFDFDQDGDADLFFTGGGTISREDPVIIGGLPSVLYRNDGDWRFKDVTGNSRFLAAPDYSQGCSVTDFDVDGFPDLYVCCYGRDRLYRNLGDGTFTEVSFRAPSQTAEWSTTATFADFDADGLPDLWVAHYADWSPERDVKCSAKGIRDLCGPSSYKGTICQVFHNSGNGEFEDWSRQVGLQGGVRGLAIVAADLNLDGWVDLYIASDVTPNQLYLGGPQLPLMESATANGVAVNEWGQAEGSMGVDIGDYDGNGLPDIWVTNFEFEDNALYQNLGSGSFLHSTVGAGLAGVSRMRVGFGTALTDFDGDGWQDLFVLNGNPIYESAETPFKQQSQLFRNLGGRFTEVTKQGGTFFRENHSGRGNAVVDLDDDGAPDLVTVQMNDPIKILRNRKTPNNYISVNLRALQGEPDATGARVSLEYEGRRIVRFATRGTGFFSQFDSRLILPVAEPATKVDVTVDWPGRGQENFRNLAVRRTHLLREGSARP